MAARRAVLWIGGISSPAVQVVVEDAERCEVVYRLTVSPVAPAFDGGPPERIEL